MSKSNEQHVVLKKVQIGTSGSYKCEVTTRNKSPQSAPYDVVSATGHLQVVGECQT